MIQSNNPNQTKVITGYSDPTWFYDLRGFFILKLCYRSGLYEQIKFFGRNLGARHLEIAIGSGTLLYLILLWRKFKQMPTIEIVGIDYVPKMLAAARKLFQHKTNIRLEIGDATGMHFADNSFDTINVANAIHCIADIDAALLEIGRVLKPGGTLHFNVILFPTGSGLKQKIASRIIAWGKRKGILYSPYTQTSIQEKLETVGFKIISESIVGNCYYLSCNKLRVD